VTIDIAPGRAVFVSDFDGTLARPDFYQLVRRDLVPSDTPDYWRSYRSGEMTHFDALREYFAAARGGEASLRGITDMMQLPEDLVGQVKRLRDAGWALIIVSAGCTWYIDVLLERAGVQLPVYANPGHLEDGRLIMQRPPDGPFACEGTGIDKAAIVQFLLGQERRVAFAGDGFPDLPAARLVAADRRFACSDLARACHGDDVAYRPFQRWQEVVDVLVGQPS